MGFGWCWVSFWWRSPLGFGNFFIFSWAGTGGSRVAPVGAVAPPPPPAVTCSQFPCHPAVTFHLLATEQKHSAGTLQKGGGSDFSAT